MKLAKSAWNIAFNASVDFTRRPRKVEQITEHWGKHSPDDKRRAFRLLYAWLRGQGLARHVLKSLMTKPPRSKLQLTLELACSELLVTLPERHPAVVSSAVDFAKSGFSKREAGLCNAVLRKASAQILSTPLQYSHPDWLVKQWRQAFGEAETEALIGWNQTKPTTYVRWSKRAGSPLPALIPTQWPNFYTYPEEARVQVIEAVNSGLAYIQDPFTRHPVEMALAAGPKTILDLCAAPGGKTRALVDAQKDSAPAVIVASDLPGPRLEQLKENLSVLGDERRPAVLAADGTALSREGFESAGLPIEYDAVILDVPCSNTGVIQRRPDVRWLLRPERLKGLVELQAALLASAANFVSPGGRLIYSTCSLESAENEAQIAAFLEKNPAYSLEDKRLSRPWTDEHDGGAAFTLTRER
tara:strand:+ start:201993 stop:203234 length:1242 start_codon:yes stop_codon:yes gene_type:complete